MVAIGTVVETAGVGWVDRSPLVKHVELAMDSLFRLKVAGGIAQKAGEIGSSVLGMSGVSTPDKLRLGLARSVLADIETWTETFARVLAADSSITSSSINDNTLLFYIADYWNLLAGVQPS